MKCAKCEKDPELREVLEALQARFQRATYGAVAGLLSSRPDAAKRAVRSLMDDHAHDPLHSWVVNGRTKKPTGYAAQKRHEKLERNSKVIDTAPGLRRILGTAPIRTSPQKSGNRG